MGIPNPYYESWYPGNGTTTIFSFAYNSSEESGFDPISANYVKCHVIFADGTIVIPTFTVDVDLLRITISALTTPENVVLNAPPVGSQVRIYRDVPETQELTSEMLKVATTGQIIQAFDRIVAMIQEAQSFALNQTVNLDERQRKMLLDYLTESNDSTVLYYDYASGKIKPTSFVKEDVVQSIGGMYLRQVFDSFDNPIFQYTIDGGVTWESILCGEAANNHANLNGRDLPSQHPASSIDFDNTGTGLTGDTVQEAIVEVDSDLDTHIGDTSNPHEVTKAQVGLENVDNTADIDKPVSTAQQTVLNLKVDTATVKDPTGFDNPDVVTVSYDSTARTVTITPNGAKFYWRGIEVALGTTHTSVAHDVAVGTYYYYYNGSVFVWSTTPWTYDLAQLAVIQYQSAYKIGIRECHGLMNWLTHDEFHSTIGTYLTAGADATAGTYVLNSSTATNKRPTFTQATIKDEDLPHTIPSVASGAYCHRYLTGSAVKAYTTDQTDFIIQNGTIPQYNQLTGGTWGVADFANNNYGAVFVMAIPVTSDAGSQKYRYLFVQPQTVNNNLATIQALTPNNLVHGESTSLLSEFVFVGKIIVRRVSGSWQIISVEKLLGNKISQTTVSGGGGYLTQVSTDATLTGNGTTATPLSVVDTNFVHKTGDETIADVKTFSSFPITPSSAPTTDYQVANRKFVVDTVSASSIYPQNFISNSRTNLHSSRQIFSMFGLSGVGAYTSSTSGFNFTNTLTEYITVSKIFAPGSSAWEITVAINPTSFAATRSIMAGVNTVTQSNYGGFNIRFNTTGKIGVYLSSNGSTWNLASNAAGSFTYTAGTKYWIKLAFTGSAYTVTYSTDGVNFNADYSLTSSTALYQGVEYNIGFGTSAVFDVATLGVIYMDSISYKIATVEQLPTWSQNNACSILFDTYSARGITNSANINTSAMTKLINTTWAAGTGAGAFVSYSTYTSFATSQTYSLFMVTNGTLNDIVAIHSSAHTNGVLVAGAITAINTALSTTITDYRYIGNCQSNAYTTPYLMKYLKQYNGEQFYDSPDCLSGYRLTPDNFIEQYGVCGTAASGTITLYVAMKNNLYKPLIWISNGTNNDSYAPQVSSNSVTTSSFGWYSSANAASKEKSWKVEGYII